MSSSYWPGFIDAERGIGRDQHGAWFVALPLTETAPGVKETVLRTGWFPGMKAGWKIVTVAIQENGRPLYVCQAPSGGLALRCCRRKNVRRNAQALSLLGWCMNPIVEGEQACRWHQAGDGRPPGVDGRQRVDYLYAGDIVNDTLEVVGFVPGAPGGDTYYIRSAQGVIRSACLRRFPNGRRCLRAAGFGTGRATGACYWHGGANNGTTNRIMNLLDPSYESLLRDTVRPAVVDPAAQQIRTRVDLLRYGWYLLIGSIIERKKWLENKDLPDRSTGIAVIASAATTIINGTVIQSDVQANQFKATAKVWASQAYCMRMGRLLVEIALTEGNDAGREVAQRVEYAMVRRGMVSNQRVSWLDDADDGSAETVERMPVPMPIGGVRPPQIVVQSQEELDLLAAMGDETKQAAYTYVAAQLGETMLSLYPLMGVLQDLLMTEERDNAPFTVRQKLLSLLQTAQKTQLRIEKALDITFSGREEELIGRDIADAVEEALLALPPDVAQRILMVFMRRKDEVELPKRGHEGRLGEKILEVAGRDEYK